MWCPSPLAMQILGLPACLGNKADPGNFRTRATHQEVKARSYECFCPPPRLLSTEADRNPEDDPKDHRSGLYCDPGAVRGYPVRLGDRPAALPPGNRAHRA